MAFAVTTRIEIGGDRDLFERVSNRLRKPSVLMQRIGILGMTRGVERLTQVLAQKPEGEAVRTGTLYNSIVSGIKGRGGGNTIFDLSDHEVSVGSNVAYARQLQQGGRINPKNAKALAIPLPVKLKRSRLSPRDIDPFRTELRFIPNRGGGKPNIIGYLVDDSNFFKFRPKGKRRKKGEPKPPPPKHTGVLLFALAKYVDQEAKPFLFWDEDDKRKINDELVPTWLGLRR
ncbi:MAG: hypothetical protein AABZ47_13080 [Planctomycetota bacterium]